MVKTIVALVVTLAVILGMSFFENGYLINKLDYFDRNLDMIIESTDGRTDGREKLAELTKWWKREKNVLHAFVPHNDIREIDGILVEADKYIENGMYVTAAARLVKLDDMIVAIKENYSFNMGNIF